MSLPAHLRSNPLLQAPGSLSCNDGELCAYIYTDNGKTHFFCAQVNARRHFECPNAWVKYYDIPERVPGCNNISVHVVLDHVTCRWGGGIVTLSGVLSHSSQHEIDVTGRGHWSDGGGYPDDGQIGSDLDGSSERR